jgi:hypothetical protein
MVCFLIKFYRIFKKEVGKVKGYRGAREFFFVRAVCMDKETRSRKRTGSRGQQKQDFEKKDSFVTWGKKLENGFS